MIFIITVMISLDFSKSGMDWFSTGSIFQRKQKNSKIVLNHKKERSFCTHEKKSC